MTADDETRQILRDLAAGQRDLAAGQRHHSERFDGLSTRMDEFERMLSAVTLQTSLIAGHVVELRTKLDGLDTALWDETARTVRRTKAIGAFLRKRGFSIFVALLGGGVGVKVLEAIFS